MTIVIFVLAGLVYLVLGLLTTAFVMAFSDYLPGDYLRQAQVGEGWIDADDVMAGVFIALFFPVFWICLAVMILSEGIMYYLISIALWMRRLKWGEGGAPPSKNE